MSYPQNKETQSLYKKHSRQMKTSKQKHKHHNFNKVCD